MNGLMKVASMGKSAKNKWQKMWGGLKSESKSRIMSGSLNSPANAPYGNNMVFPKNRNSTPPERKRVAGRSSKKPAWYNQLSDHLAERAKGKNVSKARIKLERKYKPNSKRVKPNLPK